MDLLKKLFCWIHKPTMDNNNLPRRQIFQEIDYSANVFEKISLYECVEGKWKEIRQWTDETYILPEFKLILLLHPVKIVHYEYKFSWNIGMLFTDNLFRHIVSRIETLATYQVYLGISDEKWLQGRIPGTPGGTEKISPSVTMEREFPADTQYKGPYCGGKFMPWVSFNANSLCISLYLNWYK